MKRIIKTLIATIIALVFCINSAIIAAADGETSGNCGDGVTWNYDAGTSTLTIDGSGRMSDYSSSENLPWYQYRADIRSIQINEGVTYIGKYAFYNVRSNDYTKLTTISLPEGLTEIAAYAFRYCRIETLNLPSTLTTIQTAALNDIQELKSVTVAEGNTAFAMYNECLYTADYKTLVFYPRVSAVKDVVIKDGCEEIGIYAFYGSGIKTVTIPSSVTVIGESAFSGSGIQSVEIPSSVKTINHGAFGSSSLKSVILNEGLETISAYAFSGTKINSISAIPKSVKVIEAGAFKAMGDVTTGYIDEITLLSTDCSFPTDSGSFNDVFYSSSHLPEVRFVYSQSTEEYLKRVEHTKYTALCLDATENHTFEKASTTATCTQAGTATMTCSVCGYSKEEDEEALGHSFTNYVSDGNATCTADGTKTAECDNGCGETDTVTDEGSMTEHIYEETVTAPTCTEQGYTEYKCKDCGNTYKSDYVEAKGHTAETVIIKEAAIGETGLKQEKCSVCGEVLSETEIPALEETTAEEELTQTTETITEETTKEAASTSEKENTTKRETVTATEKQDNSFNTDYSLFRVVGGIECAKAAVRFDEEITGYEVFISDGSGFKNGGEITNSDENYVVFLNLKSDCNYQFKLKAFKIIDGKKIYANEESRTVTVMIK